MIELKHLRKEYESATPLEDVSTVIKDGDVIAVIGPSGTGKSTLLRCINRLETPTSGQILVDGEDVTANDCDLSKVRQKMGMVFQSFNLFNHMTVIENIMYAPVKLRHLSRQDAYDRGKELLKKVGLADRALNYPDQLSGGQKQRIAIARALAMDPEVILFDEPTSALDPTMVGEVQAVIEDLSHSGKTMMIVTHEMQFARRISNRVFYMDEGGIYEDGTPEQVFEHPLKENTRRFVQKLKVLEIPVDSKNFDFPGAAAQIEQYCEKNRISRGLSTKIQSVFEEICMQILLPAIEKPQITAVIEYMEENATAAMTFRYNGDFRIEETENDLAYKVVKGQTASMRYLEENADASRIVRFELV